MAQPTRPRIGISMDFVAASKTAVAQARLDAGYFDSIWNAGGLPILLPPLNQAPAVEAQLADLDGVVLSGGLDLDPRRCGQLMHAKVQLLPPRRDDNDRQLVQQIVKRRLPVLGIGLGMQQLNVACGGTLFLHLPEDMPRAMPHRDPANGPHRHLVLLEPGSRLDEIYGGGEMRVNSAHHQAVRLVGNGLRVGARAPDGVIEALEALDTSWFCIGVQWHPEAETASALDLQLLEAFIQACLRQGNTLGLAA